VTVALLVVAAVLAIVDWVAVARSMQRVEYVAKPLTLLALIVAAASADLPDVKGWVVTALVLGLLGDVGLMLSSDADGPPDLPFLLGLGSFLLGHVCYLVAFATYGLHGWQVLAGVLVVGGSAALVLPRVLAGARRVGGPSLMSVVAAYAVTLSAVAVLGLGTAAIVTAIGALLFLASDSLIAWERFVHRLPHGPLAVIVTYHLAQGLILLGLAF
jgi:uncharacterized membrane protein YhhN